MYKIIYVPTGEEVVKPCNYRRGGKEMTIRQLRRFLRTDKAYLVRYHDKEIYFTREPEFQDTHPLYNKEFCERMGRVKILKSDIKVVRT